MSFIDEIRAVQNDGMKINVESWVERINLKGKLLVSAKDGYKGHRIQVGGFGKVVTDDESKFLVLDSALPIIRKYLGEGITVSHKIEHFNTIFDTTISKTYIRFGWEDN